MLQSWIGLDWNGSPMDTTLRNNGSVLKRYTRDFLLSLKTTPISPMPRPFVKKPPRHRRGWAYALRQITPDKMSLPSVLLLNARSLFNKYDDFASLLQKSMYLNVCAICVTETWLADCIPDSTVTPNGFVCCRSDRMGSGRSGGSAIFINSSWCKNPKTVFSYSRNAIKAVGLKALTLTFTHFFCADYV